jgi:hypothetical protein
MFVISEFDCTWFNEDLFILQVKKVIILQVKRCNNNQKSFLLSTNKLIYSRGAKLFARELNLHIKYIVEGAVGLNWAMYEWRAYSFSSLFILDVAS